jgi:hypothetical protein
MQSGAAELHAADGVAESSVETGTRDRDILVTATAQTAWLRSCEEWWDQGW